MMTTIKNHVIDYTMMITIKNVVNSEAGRPAKNVGRGPSGVKGLGTSASSNSYKYDHGRSNYSTPELAQIALNWFVLFRLFTFDLFWNGLN